MKYNYDVIVIGAGNAGLMAALTIAEKGKKVLVLESNSGPGGLATSFVRGRFEFEASLRELKSVGSETDKGILRKIFDEYDLNEKIEWIELPEAYKLIKKSTQKEIYSIPFGVDEFIKKMEEYVPESKDKLTEFFELLKEVYEAVQYIENSNEEINYDYFKEKYPNFSTVSSYSLQTVLDRLKMPQKLQELISSYWIYFGASSININFAHYASAFYELLTKKAYIPKNRSYELSCIIERKIRNYGGKVWYNEEVKNIIVQDNKVIGVKTQNGNTYTTNYVVCILHL
jgi:prolycopene isomerase